MSVAVPATLSDATAASVFRTTSKSSGSSGFLTTTGLSNASASSGTEDDSPTWDPFFSSNDAYAEPATRPHAQSVISGGGSSGSSSGPTTTPFNTPFGTPQTASHFYLQASAFSPSSISAEDLTAAAAAALGSNPSSYTHSQSYSRSIPTNTPSISTHRGTHPYASSYTAGKRRSRNNISSRTNGNERKKNFFFLKDNVFIVDDDEPPHSYDQISTEARVIMLVFLLFFFSHKFFLQDYLSRRGRRNAVSMVKSDVLQIGSPQSLPSSSSLLASRMLSVPTVAAAAAAAAAAVSASSSSNASAVSVSATPSSVTRGFSMPFQGTGSLGGTDSHYGSLPQQQFHLDSTTSISIYHNYPFFNGTSSTAKNDSSDDSSDMLEDHFRNNCKVAE